MRISQCIIICLSEFFSFVSVYIILIKYVNLQLNLYIKLILIINCCLLVHYLFGFILIISNNLNNFMASSKDNSMKGDFLLSYFITSTFLAATLAYPSQVSKYVISGFIGVFICYILNLKILLNIMRNPGKVKISPYDEKSFIKVSLIVGIVVIMIVLNLFLGVCLASSLQNGFSNNPSYFDLFYYTVVTFTTIGFGDIIPLSILAKLIAIVISATSIICITIFLGSIYSYRDRD